MSDSDFSIDLLLDVINNSPIGTVLKSPNNSQILFANKTFSSLAHIPIEKLIGNLHNQVFGNDLSRKLELLDKKVIEDKIPIKTQIKNPFGNNPELVLEVQKLPLFDKESGDIQCIVEYYQNISQVARADFILRETEVLYKKIFENLPLGIVILRAEDFTIIDVNTNFLELFELEFDKVMYQSVFELPFCTDKERLLIYLKTARELSSTQTLERTITLPSGKKLNVIFNFFFMNFLDQEPWFVLVVNDVSALEEANQEILSNLKKEYELNRLKNRFVSIISHELRTPLTSLMLSVEILQKFGDKISEQEKIKNFEQILASIKTISNLLENVSRLEKLTDNDFILNPTKISLQEKIYQIISGIEKIYNTDNKIQIHSKIEDILLTSDEVLVEIILKNLIENAVKYSDKEKPVHINIQQNNNNVEILIQNFGKPIPQKDINYIFLAFYRGSNITETRGFGLGLSLVKKAVELLNGTIELTSSESEGTIVKLNIPNSINNQLPF